MVTDSDRRIMRETFLLIPECEAGVFWSVICSDSVVTMGKRKDYWRFKAGRWELVTGEGNLLAYVDSVPNRSRRAAERLRYPLIWRVWDANKVRLAPGDKMWTLDAARDLVNSIYSAPNASGAEGGPRKNTAGSQS
jgi:hypothetical protein